MVKLIALVCVGVALAALTGLWARRRLTDRPRGDSGVEANARLTGYAAMVLLIPLAAEVATGIRPGLLAHGLIGFLLVPPVLAPAQCTAEVRAGNRPPFVPSAPLRATCRSR
jgi:hypothetical protein